MNVPDSQELALPIEKLYYGWKLRLKIKFTEDGELQEDKEILDVHGGYPKVRQVKGFLFTFRPTF